MWCAHTIKIITMYSNRSDIIIYAQEKGLLKKVSTTSSANESSILAWTFTENHKNIHFVQFVMNCMFLFKVIYNFNDFVLKIY